MKRIYACGKKFTNCFCISQRLLLGIMTSFSLFTAYTVRVALSIGITEMVVRNNVTEKDTSGLYCPRRSNKTHRTVQNSDVLYDWDENVQGLILGSFYWGYLFTHIPGAIIAQHFGGKHVIGVGMFLNSVLTFVTPPIIFATNGNATILIIIRVIMGCGQGVMYPVCAALLSQWIPPKEKASISSITFAGSLLGTVFSNSISGILISYTKSWETVFYFFGIFGLLWNVLWQLLCYSFPRTHPCITEKEKEFLDDELAETVSKLKMKIPWKSICTSGRVWALLAGQLGHNWGWFVMVTDLPKYMSTVLGFDVMENGLLSSIPYFMMWISSMAFGYIVDWMIVKNHLTIKKTRLLFGTIAHMGPAIFLVLASYVGCDQIMAVVMFSIAMFFMGAFFCGMKVNALDLSPNFAGTLVALVNGLGIISGMCVPSIVGYLAPEQTMEQWRLVFWITFGVLACSATIYVLFMSTEVQPWNNPEKEDES